MKCVLQKNKPNEILVDEILDDSDNSDEYDSSSSSDDSHDTQEQTKNENIGHISRSGRVIRATVRLDLLKENWGKIRE
ncbi:Hypothetical predicted protein [Mytilus galloprovincialis]|uniref:Uncharacterized protein n=1 Tax=Mytilus galloprovincialis TaxID=29158 RepID=A0A8B6F0T2_MYTGA|nr:Hypothetical predicted protein [Mytilus galloprovincialis]